MPKGGANGSQFRLHVSGNVQAMWLENGGRIASGNDIAIRDSGVLWLQHQPGIVVAWIEAPGVQGSKTLGDWFRSFQETSVKPPQTVNLRGKSQILNFKLERATMLHVRTNVPVVTHYMVEGQPPLTEAHLQGANINLLAPAGASRLILRASRGGQPVRACHHPGDRDARPERRRGPANPAGAGQCAAIFVRVEAAGTGGHRRARLIRHRAQRAV